VRSFFEYFIILALINQTGITIFRAIGAIGRAPVLCNVAAFLFIAYSLLLCGFTITQSAAPLACKFAQHDTAGSTARMHMSAQSE
jgi:hypothetical protein